MPLVLTQPAVGATGWGTTLNANWAALVAWSQQNAPQNIVTAEVVYQNSVAETTLVSDVLPTGLLIAGMSFRVKMWGTIQVQAASGTLTFRNYIGANSSGALVVASRANANGPVGFVLDAFMTIRTAGAGGTFLANTFGFFGFSDAAGNLSQVSAITATSAVDTTQATPTVKLTGQWATASATNILKVEQAMIEANTV